MSKSYTGYGARTQVTPQTEAIPGREAVMAANNAGGVSFVVDDMMRFQRFCILGAVGGVYYIGEHKLVKQNLQAVENLLRAGRGLEVVAKIVEISDAGRAPSNDPALFALARCAACDVHPSQPLKDKAGKEMGTHRRILHPDDIAVRQAAYGALPKVARTGTHFFHFLEYVKQFRGRGPLHDHSVEAWYQSKAPERLAYQAVKYQNRDGWSQRDVLRLARPKPVDSAHNAIYQWIVKGWDATPSEVIPAEEALGLIWAYERAKHLEDVNEVADLILKYRLPREAVPTTSLNSVKVWEALLQDMPLEAMLRNLATMTKNAVLVPMGSFTQSVATRLRSQEAIQKVRLHPIKILAALTTYQSGKSVRGSATWEPLREIVDALNDAFYLSFAAVVPSGKRLLIAIDVSGSMHGTQINGIAGMNCHTAAAAMAMVTARSEQNWHIMAFDTVPHPLSISPTQRLDDVVRTVASAGNGGTDCAIPMQWALQQKVLVDAFLILTDSESWHGSQQPIQALQAYRQQINSAARIVNVQMTSTQVTGNDPQDDLALDVCGFDTNAPSIIASFIAGEF